MIKTITYCYGVWAVLTLSGIVYGADFPGPIAKCHMTDEKCMVEQANKFVSAHPHGIPEAGIDDFDPLNVGTISITGNKQNPANIEMQLSDVKFYKYSKVNITGISGFTKDTSKPMKVTLTAWQPQLIMKGKYKIKGNILVLPITGEGDVEWELNGVSSKSRAILKPTERDGKLYMHIQESKLLSKIDDVKVKMTNLFNGDKALSENMLKLINENWEALSSEEINPKINEAIAKAQVQFLEKFFENIPYDQYFLPE